MVLQVTFKNQVGGLKTNPPRGGRGQVAHIDRKEVTPGGQYIQTPATRRATGPGRHEAPVQGIQQTLHLRRATRVQARRDNVQQSIKNRAHFSPLLTARQLQAAVQRLLD